MGADSIAMPENSMMMIHNATGATRGTANEHEKQVEVLRKFDGQIANIYAKRVNGLTADGASLMMNAETWLTGSEAVDKGFADTTDGEKMTARIDPRVCFYANAPKHLIEAAVHQPVKEIIMTDTNEAARKAAEIETRAKLESEIRADILAEEKAKVAADKEKTETISADHEKILTAERERCSEITSICSLAGKPEMAASFIADGKSYKFAVAELEKVKDTAPPMDSHHNGNSGAPAASWDKAIKDYNSRF
jgi:hypothetical protein